MRMYTSVAIKPTSLSVSIEVSECIGVTMHSEGAQEWSVH